MASRHLSLNGPAGRLEALFTEGKPGYPAVVVCHPHPLYGGTMHNKVTYWIAKTFSDRDCSVLRFNFRGVGASAGEWDEARGEVDDTRAAINWLAGHTSGSPLWLAGFSFGCYAALRAARADRRVERFFAVAPAVNRYDFEFFLGDNRPLVVIQGTADEIVPFEQVEQWLRRHGSAQYYKLEGAGHFFPQRLHEVSTYLAQSFSDT